MRLSEIIWFLILCDSNKTDFFFFSVESLSGYVKKKVTQGNGRSLHSEPTGFTTQDMSISKFTS